MQYIFALKCRAAVSGEKGRDDAKGVKKGEMEGRWRETKMETFCHNFSTWKTKKMDVTMFPFNEADSQNSGR